jgi:DNA-binding response OmpR family regulator
MRVVLITADPAAQAMAGSVRDALEDLGCGISPINYDLEGVSAAARAGKPALIVIDTPGRVLTGLSLVKKLRSHEDVLGIPLLMVLDPTELGSLARVEVSPDDIILAPVLSTELHARMRLIDRRFADFENEERLQIGDLVIDLQGYEVTLNGRVVPLTRQEFELLACLAEAQGRMLSREQLLERAWGRDYEGGARTVDVHIRRLRAKLGDLAERIETVRGGGYRMRVPARE